jgi:hypothetical protein
MVERELKISDKRDLEDMLEDYAARCVAEEQKVNGGTIERFYKQQKANLKFQPTVTRRQLKGGPRRTDFKDVIDGGTY